MSRFVQMHILTAYPPSNPNRDDLGRPKTAVIGSVSRMRISSQALKRAIRTDDAFRSALTGNLGERTQRMGDKVREYLLEKGASEDKALEIARTIADLFGKVKGETTYIEQLAFISPEERAAAFELAEQILSGGVKIPEKEKGKDKGSPDTEKFVKEFAPKVLQTADGAVDVAMFGRMLADNPDFNRDAAVQVAHAFTTNQVDVEDDYYTAVDDLKTAEEDAGAGFIGETGFGAGVFYLYICVNRKLLLKNLSGDTELAGRALSALVRAAATASPSGKKNSFANHVRAEYLLLEHGDGQPRSLASAFTKPVRSDDQLGKSVEALKNQRTAFEKTYGKDWDADKELHVHVGVEASATLDELATFAAQGMESLA
ncbi:MAG: type I-E CRISPR-associated protein Cas7/Cse4/CasC [Gemmatimonadota bacterium]|nr:type I-E CRISPR-associated protein Cas7/Cse4/CasC [Gemmatimonadota bacterium]